MKNNIVSIIKKEFTRFFGDKRMVFTTVLLPGLMIYVLYAVMGQGLSDKFSTSEDYVYSIYAENLPASVEPMLKELSVDLKEIEAADVDGVKKDLEEKEADLLMVFPEEFDAEVAAYDSLNATTEAPQIVMYYNSAKTESYGAYQMMTETLDAYESVMANKFDINGGEEKYDLASEKDESGRFFSMMLPMLLMVFLFSGCMAIAPESIAGEKERGTIATLLVTPMKRSHLALGKIISLGVIGLLGGLSSFVGMMLSLPNMMKGMAEEGSSVSASVYTVTDYLLLLLVILTTVLVIVAAISVISAFAKSVKEASTAVMPLMILVMVVAFTSLIGGAPKEWYFYLIPFYNSVQCMNGIFGFAYLPVNMVIALASNVAYTLVLAGLLGKIFGSEKIMYI